MWLGALAAWLGMLIVAVAAGAVRQRVLEPRLGEQRAHQVGTLAVAAVLGLMASAYALAVVATGAQALGLGALWVILTVAFEFGFFGLVMKKPWRTLLADYRLDRGRLWPLLLLVVLFAPVVAVELRG